MPSGYICERCGALVLIGQEHTCKADRIAILIFGKAGTGKSTLARKLNSVLWDDSFIIPLAAEVKRIAKECFDWDGEKDEKGRRLLQVIGTEAGREYNKDIWVDIVIEKFLNTRYGIMIVDDVRFPNEIERIREKVRYVQVIKMVGPQRCELNEGAQQHTSETSLDDYEEYTDVIHNDGGIDQLVEMAIGIVQEIANKWM